MFGHGIYSAVGKRIGKQSAKKEIIYIFIIVQKASSSLYQ